MSRSKSNNKLIHVFSQNKSFVGAVLCLSILGSLKTLTRNPAWKSEYALYSTDVQNAPNNARLHYWYADEVRARAEAAQTNEEKMKLLDVSISEFDRALEIYSDFPDAYAERGLAYYAKGDKQHAAADYKRAIDLNVGSWEVFNNLGVVYGEQNKLDEAMQYFELAVKRDYRFPDAYKNMANLYFLQGDCDTATEKYFEALKYATADDSALQLEVYDHLSVCFQKKGDLANQQKYAILAQGLAPAAR
jgi:tetratricopeptide (TPR) repeat protein